MNNHTQELMTQVLKQQENLILEQLGELLTRKLLVVEATQPVLTSEYDVSGKYTLELKQAIRLKLRDQEYIENLEKENKELKEIIQKLKDVL